MQVRYKKNNVRIIATSRGDIQLMPGINTVKQELWDEAKENPLVRHSIKEGIIEPQKPKAKSFGELNGKEAIRQVEQCNNLETLEGWAQETNIKKVRGAIEARIKEIITLEEGDGKDKPEK